MNGCEGIAHLEWWANSSTCLARIPVRISTAPSGGVWDPAASPALDGDEEEAIQLLIDLSPFFTLRFEDDSVTEVEAEHSGDINHLRLSATSGEDRYPKSSPKPSTPSPATASRSATT